MSSAAEIPPVRTVEPDGCPQCSFVEYVGYEVRGVYDGVLYWVCPACGLGFPRWVGDSDQRMVQLSQQYADEHNEKKEKP